MADNLTPLPIKTLTNGAAAVKVVGATTTNELAVASDGAALVEVKELPTAAALGDTMANPTTTVVGALLAVWDGSTNWVRVRGDETNGIDVDVTRVSGNVTVIDGGGSLSVDDNGGNISIDDGGNSITVDGSVSVTGNVTVIDGGGAISVDDNGSTISIDDGGGSITVDGTVSISGSVVTDAKMDTLTSASLAAGANVSLPGTQVASGKTGKLMRVVASSSVPVKVEIQTVLNGAATTRVVAFTSAANPVFDFEAPTKDFITQAENAGAGSFDGFQIKFTNKDDLTAGDVYATVFWDEV